MCVRRSAGHTCICLAEFCVMREQMTLNAARWELARELMWQRESRAGFRHRSGASPCGGSGDGGDGLEEDSGAASGRAERVWLLVGSGRRGTSRQDRKVNTSEHLGVGHQESGDGGGRRGLRGV